MFQGRTQYNTFIDVTVMGLTLDFDSHYVYWIVRGQEGSHLYRAPMMKPGVIVNKIRVSLLARTNIAGPLSYFNGRLLWLRDEKIAAISDMNGAYVATMEGKSLSGLKMVYAIDDSLQRYSGMYYTKISIFVQQVFVVNAFIIKDAELQCLQLL